MPSWADFDPAEIKPLLPHLMVTRYERSPFRVRYSLVGTFVVQYGGADFTGRYLDELEFPSEVDTDWPALHRLLVGEGRPVFGVCTFVTESGLRNTYEVAMFPVADPTGSFVERGVHIEDFPVGARSILDQNTIALKPVPMPSPSPSKVDPVTAGTSLDAPRIGARLEPISAGDRDFRVCLEEAKLPTMDLTGAGKWYFRLTEGGESRAYGGFETRGSHALLRSIVVAGRARGHGYGRTLVHGLVAEAQKLGLMDAYLLTETAAPFFAALGFVPCARETVPPEIATTEQFAALCPASAKLMRRMIG
jgi:GNAT superfamily N-acetyltransferase